MVLIFGGDMATHVNSKLDRKTTGAPRGAPRKIVAPTSGRSIMSPLDAAVDNNRPPSTDELFEEAKCGLGVALIELRGANDAVKKIKSYLEAVRAVAQIKNFEMINDLQPQALAAMSDQELKEHVNKLVSNIN